MTWQKSVVSEFNLEMVTVSIIIYAAIQVSSSCQGALFQQLQCDRPSLPWALNKCGMERMGHSIIKTSLQIYSKFLRKTMNGPIRWSDGLISKYLYLIWTLLILSHREVFGNKNGLMNARQATVDPANGFLSKVKAQATKCCADQTRVPGKYPQCTVLGLLFLTNLCKIGPNRLGRYAYGWAIWQQWWRVKWTGLLSATPPWPWAWWWQQQWHSSLLSAALPWPWAWWWQQQWHRGNLATVPEVGHWSCQGWWWTIGVTRASVLEAGQ